MSIRFVLDPPLTGELRQQVVDLWVEVTNAGGAVGFVGPVTAEDVLPTAESAFVGVAEGHDSMLIGIDDGHLVALLFLTGNRFVLKDHWRILKRVMIAPGSQGRGWGGALMREAAVVARAMGLTALQVTVRGGQGIEGFYKALGYREVGRLPAALRVAPDDDRDEILMWLPLPLG